MGKGNKTHGKPQNRQKKFQHQRNKAEKGHGKLQDHRSRNPFSNSKGHGNLQDHRSRNPFSSGLAINSAQNESKREIVKNEVLEYLQKAETPKPWTEDKQKTDLKKSDGNPFGKQQQTIKWEKFKDDKNVTSGDKHFLKRVMTKLQTKFQAPTTLEHAIHTFQNQKNRKKHFMEEKINRNKTKGKKLKKKINIGN